MNLNFIRDFKKLYDPNFSHQTDDKTFNIDGWFPFFTKNVQELVFTDFIAKFNHLFSQDPPFGKIHFSCWILSFFGGKVAEACVLWYTAGLES